MRLLRLASLAALFLAAAAAQDSSGGTTLGDSEVAANDNAVDASTEAPADSAAVTTVTPSTSLKPGTDVVDAAPSTADASVSTAGSQDDMEESASGSDSQEAEGSASETTDASVGGSTSASASSAAEVSSSSASGSNAAEAMAKPLAPWNVALVAGACTAMLAAQL